MYINNSLYIYTMYNVNPRFLCKDVDPSGDIEVVNHHFGRGSNPPNYSTKVYESGVDTITHRIHVWYIY